MTDTARIMKRWIPLLFLGNVIAFLAAHTAYLFDSPVFQYIHLYIDKIWNFLFPVLAVRLLLLVLYRGFPKVLLTALFASCIRCIYFLLFYYEYYVLTVGYVSSDAILLSLLRTLVMLVLTLVHLLVFFALTLALSALFRKRKGSGLALSEFCQQGSDGHMLDFSQPSIFVCIVISLLELFLALAREIYDTVTFLSSSINTLEVNELLLMLFNYVLLLLLCAAAHFSCVLLARSRYTE